MKRIFIVFAFMFLSLPNKSSAQQDTLFYVGDPMCSWCYAFGPELDKVLKSFPDLPLKIIVGGLRAHGDETFGQLSGFLKEHWEEIHLKTGQPFSYRILEKKQLIYNTEPACRAVVTIRSVSPSSVFSFFKDLQKSFYDQNEDPTSLTTFLAVSSSLGTDPVKFEKYFNSSVIQNETERDFLLAQSLQVSGFPSLIALKNGKLYRVSNGYSTGEEIIVKLTELGFIPQEK